MNIQFPCAFLCRSSLSFSPSLPSFVRGVTTRASRRELPWAERKHGLRGACLRPSLTREVLAEHLLSVRCCGALGLCSVSFKAASQEASPHLSQMLCALSTAALRSCPACQALVSVSCTFTAPAKPERRASLCAPAVGTQHRSRAVAQDLVDPFCHKGLQEPNLA